MEEEATANLPEGKITDEGLEALRKLIGVPLRINNIFNQFASKEAIRNFANGIGDPNPLWSNEEYALKTPFKSLVAPPGWYYSIFPTWVSIGLPGVHGFHSGSDWEFFKQVRYGDTINPECCIQKVEVKDSQFAGKIAIVYFESTFTNQRNEVTAKVLSWSVRAERRAAREKGKYTEIKLPHPWTEADLARVEDEVMAEEVRGANVRYWEDVTVGEQLKPVVKGPFGLTDMVAFCVGAAPVQLLAHHASLQVYRRHPAWAFRDPTTFALEPIYSVHYNKAAAHAAGLPYPYDVGTQRQCWLMHLLTNWMGDYGWLKKNFAQYRAFVYHSDVVWIKGVVTKKYVDANGEHCVDVETSAFNQRGENTMPGHSTVVLPSRERNTWPQC